MDLFVIKESQIKGAGKGVFYLGEEVLKKGETLFEYEGIVLGGKKERAFRSDRSFNLGDGYEIYGTGIASFINDGLNYFPSNCEFVVFPDKKVFIKSTCDILPNDELFIPYGEEFWKVHGSK